MANKITFQFDDSLDYQLQAVQSTVELFRGISRKVDGIYRPSRSKIVSCENNFADWNLHKITPFWGNIKRPDISV